MGKEEDVIYFELNNWFAVRHYPDEEPFTSWMGNDLNLKFEDEAWVRENRLCVVRSTIDMSTNFCITATKAWVLENCPNLLDRHTKFLRHPETDGHVYGQFGDEFLVYAEDNFGVRDSPWEGREK